MTPMDFQKIKEYIGIDIKPCFSPLNHFKAYIYSKIVYFYPQYLYLTERGPQKTSLDQYLYTIALKEGVIFKFTEPLTPNNLHTIPSNSIIATGTASGLCTPLHLHTTPFIHLNSHGRPEKSDHFCIAYFKPYIGGYGYAYIAGNNTLTSVEIDFKKTTTYQKNLNRFITYLKNTENLSFDKWTLVDDYIPNKPHLIKRIHQKTYILAGALGGFHDPFFGFGVNSALISGKIAAMTVISKKTGLFEFNNFNSTLSNMYLLSKIYHHLPLKKIILPAVFKETATHLPFVGSNLLSIPSFTHSDCFKIKKIES